MNEIVRLRQYPDALPDPALGHLAAEAVELDLPPDDVAQSTAPIYLSGIQGPPHPSPPSLPLRHSGPRTPADPSAPARYRRRAEHSWLRLRVSRLAPRELGSSFME